MENHWGLSHDLSAPVEVTGILRRSEIDRATSDFTAGNALLTHMSRIP
jgi:hypothetical protein